MRFNRMQPTHSALQNYDRFTGWENRETDQSEHILKLLRNNLHTYEENHHHSKQVQSPPPPKKRRRSPSLAQDKQNELKLPILSSPEMNLLPKRGSFLTLKSRNILKEAIENTQNMRKPQLIIHQSIHKQKLKPINHRKYIDSVPSQQNQPLFPTSQNLMMKKIDNTRLLRIKTKVNRCEQRFDNCEFGDERLIRNVSNQRYKEQKLWRLGQEKMSRVVLDR